jgi:transcriptional regulator with XRE-family HTH domain
MVKAPLSNPPRDAVDRVSSFASCLRSVRRKLDLKQSYLSSAIGCSEAAISLWEAGHRFPTLKNLQRLLKAIGAGGATAAEQLGLREAWLRDKSSALLHPYSVVAAGPLSSLSDNGV